MTATKRRAKRPPPNPYGRPTKAEGGLTESVLLRMTAEMRDTTAVMAAERSRAQNRVVTAADLFREWIAAGIERERAAPPVEVSREDDSLERDATSDERRG